MFQNNARYIRLVDRQPASLSCTETDDVPCGIEVGMEFESATAAFVIQPIAGFLIDCATSGAFLTGVPCIYVEHGLSDAFDLVINKLLKLTERPVAERLVESRFQPLLPTNPELLQRYRIERLCRYPVRHLMVHIGHKAVLLPRQTPQFAPGGAGVFSLKFATKMLIAALDRSNAIGSIELVAGKHSVIDYPSIDAEDGVWCTRVCG